MSTLLRECKMKKADELFNDRTIDCFKRQIEGKRNRIKALEEENRALKNLIDFSLKQAGEEPENNGS